jgi:hypothetical protein
MASLTYNLKKYLRFVVKKPSILAQVISPNQENGLNTIKFIILNLKSLILSFQNFYAPKGGQKINHA